MAFGFRRSITVDPTKVGGVSDLTDFTVLVDVTSTSLRTIANGGNVTNASGYDVVFKDGDGNVLDHELASYTASSGRVVSWVRVPSLSTSVDTVFYAYYGDETISVSQENVTGAWDSDYFGVYHLEADANPIQDRAASDNDLARTSSASAVAAQVLNGLDFTSAGTYAKTSPNGGPNSTGPLTISCWAYVPTGMGAKELLGYGALGPPDGVRFALYADTATSRMYVECSNRSAYCTYSTLDSWHHVVAVMPVSAGTMADALIYVDGAVQSMTVAAAGALGIVNTQIVAADIPGGIGLGNRFTGRLDEARLATVARSAGWITTEYNNQSSPSTFLALGAEEVVSAGDPGASSSTSSGNDAAAVFRVTTYQLSGADYSGKIAKLHLRHELSEDYFVMISPTAETTGTAFHLGTGMRVTGDPYGTGDLTQTEGNWLELTRAGAGTDGGCSVVVVECLRDRDGGGFRLVSVESTNLPAYTTAGGTQSVADTSATAWKDSTRIVPFGGVRGGGISGTGTTAVAADWPTYGLRITRSGTATLTFNRYGVAADSTDEANVTTYVVQWGTEWQVQHVQVTGTNGGAGVDATGEYNTGAISEVTRARTWLWWAGYTDQDGAGEGWAGLIVALGDGVAQNSSESTVAVGLAVAGVTKTVEVYAMTNSRISTSWQFHTEGEGTNQTETWTVSAPTQAETIAEDDEGVDYAVGNRFALQSTASQSTSTSLYSEQLFSTYITASTSIVSRRGDTAPTLDWAAWLQVVDFGAVIVPASNVDRVFRVTTLELGVGDFTGATFDLDLPFDLSAHYFVMLTGSRSDVANPAPDTNAVRVTHDPFPSGDLTASGATNRIRLTRTTATGTWRGTVTVVECLRDYDTNGFRLRDVHALSASAVSVGDGAPVEQRFTPHPVINWTSYKRTTVFTGPRGGGATTSATAAAAVCSVYGAAYVDSDDRIVLLRQDWSDDLDAATFTAYVVEWGSAWQVQRCRWDIDPLGGAGADAAGEYADLSIEDVASANSWLWIGGGTAGETDEKSPYSLVAALGNGVTVPASTANLAVALSAQSTAAIFAYVLTHEDLAVDWTFRSNTSSTTLSETVDASAVGEAYGTSDDGVDYTLGQRFGLILSAVETAGSGNVSSGTVFPRHTSASVLTLKRGDGTGTWEGWSQSVDLASVTARTSATVADDTQGPQPYLILRDGNWEGVDNVVSATSQGGLVPGPAVPATANRSFLVAYQEDEDVTATEAYDYYVSRSGGIDATCGFIYKSASEATAKYRGLNALTILHKHVLSTAGVMETDPMYGHHVCYARRSGKILIAYTVSGSEINVESRAVNAAPSSWALAATIDVTTTNMDSIDYSESGSIGLVETDDGTLLLFYRTESGTTYDDICAFSSVDGGTTWSPALRRIGTSAGLNGFLLGGGTGMVRFRTARSGDWIRLSGLGGEANGGTGLTTLYSVMSSDRGASWSQDTGSVPTIGNFQTPAANASAGAQVFDIAGMDDASGTFLLAYCDSLATNVVKIASAIRDESWSTHTDLAKTVTVNLTSPVVKAVWWVRAHDKLWLYVWVEGSDGSEFVAYYTDVADPLNADLWSTVGRITHFAGGLKWGPWQPRACWAGNQSVMFAGLIDQDDVGVGTPCENGAYILQGGGWDQYPLQLKNVNGNAAGIIEYLFAGCLERVAWHAAIGSPAGDGTNSDANTTWTRTTNASFTATWSPREQTLEASDATGFVYYAFSEASGSAVEGWHAILKISSERAAPSSGEHVGIRIFTDEGAGIRRDFSVRIGRTEIVIVDNVAASTLATVATTVFQGIGEIRIATRSLGASLYVMVRQHTSASQGGDWTTIASLAGLDGGGAHTTADIRWGILAGIAGSGTTSVEWHEFVAFAVRDGTTGAITTEANLGQFASNVVKPDEMIGAPASRYPILLPGGVAVRFGGSGGMVGDTLTGTLDYTRGVQALGVDSPQQFWESTSEIENAIVLTSDPTTVVISSVTQAVAGRWQVDAAALIGTQDRTVTVEFADSNSWSSPSAAIEVSADLFTDLRVIAVRGASVQVEALSGALPQPGEVIGRFLRFTNAGAWSGATYRIRDDHDVGNGWIHLDTAVALNNTAVGVSVGATCVIYADRLVLRTDDVYRYAYMRVVFPAITVPTSTADDDDLNLVTTHRLGAIVPGHALDFDVPLAWTHRDNEQPNNTQGRTRGAASWEYEEGPVQRVIEARSVGDVERWRDKYRDLISKLHGYSARPCVLVVDPEFPADTALYGRVTTGGQFDNAGWWVDSQGRWRQAGDIDVIFTEEP